MPAFANSFFGDLLGGFMQRKQQIEAQNLAEAGRSQEREGRVYEALLASPDPEIRSLALSGVLEASQPVTARKRKSGLAGWMGEREASPIYQRLQQLINTPVQVPEMRETLPSHGMVSGQALVTPPPSSMSAAQPTESPVRGGPPPTPTVNLRSMGGTPVATGRMISQPRQVLLTPEESIRQMAVAKARADIEGDIEAYTPYLGRDAATEQVIAERTRRGLGGASTFQTLRVEVPNGQGGWEPYSGIAERAPNGQIIDAMTRQPIAAARMAQTTASTTLGADREAIAREVYGKPATQLGQAQMAHVNALQLQRAGQLKYSQAITFANQMLPYGTNEAKLALAGSLMDATAAPVAEPVAAPGQTPANPSAPPAVQPAAAPAAPAAPGTTPAQTPAATPTAGAPPRVSNADLGKRIPVELQTTNRDSGKPLPTAVATALAKAKSTNTLIDQALTALGPYRADNTLEGSLKLARDYRLGYESATNAAAQLADLAGLQASAQAQLTGGASRAVRFYVDRRQHVPRLPSGRQTIIGSIIGGKATQIGGQLLHGDEAGFDTPASMYQKLQNAKANNQNFIDAIEQSARETVQPLPSHGGPPASGAPLNAAAPAQATPAPSTSPQAYKDAQGVWRIGTPPTQ